MCEFVKCEKEPCLCHARSEGCKCYRVCTLISPWASTILENTRNMANIYYNREVTDRDIIEDLLKTFQDHVVEVQKTKQEVC